MNIIFARYYKGSSKVNPFAYLGMLGDVSTIIGLYFLNKYRKQRKVKKDAIKAEIALKNAK